MNKKSLFHAVLSMVSLLAVLSVSADTGSVQRTPTFRFGVVADIQYADKDSRGKRDYRRTLDRLSECVSNLNTRSLLFTIQLGDMIDGHNDSVVRSVTDLDCTLAVFNRLDMSKRHVIGNHCLAAGREVVLDRCGLKQGYYEFTETNAPGWRFVVLDGNDGGRGMFSRPQVDWLSERLVTAHQRQERVIVFCHFPLPNKVESGEQTGTKKTVRPPVSVLDLVGKSGCVVAWVAGHEHDGGYAFSNGVHHVTVRGMVENPDRATYAVFEVGPDEIRETGFGREPNRILPLNK